MSFFLIVISSLIPLGIEKKPEPFSKLWLFSYTSNSKAVILFHGVT
ncbi:hypothetical protein B4146_2650 [Bacillus subtilis]|uniref:Uncharacterized protein n=1 Tax=Bacillus subtilis TaxID=1423 RepID=A0AAP1EAW6_BACIU|nr:hypothetical protein B4146_2650 [Bacillus subtilis]KZD88804.1 hypothetical protein B4122_4229 [Bacillus subtilis]KZD91744.1 hypothetical protein B4122_2386 [Bacillus subtilis]